MKLSFTTLGCPDWSLEQIAKNAQAFGYEGVELRTHSDGNHFSPDASAGEAKKVAEMFRAHGAPVFSVMGYTRFAFLDQAEVAKNQELMRKLIGVAEAMGAKYIRTFAGNLPKGADIEAMTETVASAIRPLAREAASRGVKLAMETHDDWCGSARLKKLSGMIGEPNGFGLVYDIFNCIHAGIEKWEDTYAALKPQILYCHLKDGWFSEDHKKHTYVPIGAGDLPLHAVVKKLKADGFNSYFSFEWEKKWHPELEPPERIFPQFTHKMKRVWNGIEP
ncbi:MAG TPA: sugar phosphate isomerase/epimerase family protein [Planctomycetota bacterium]|nr:sugar phosphate isomerase/epimerase family protein [Planctomycetota bacterium]